MNAAQRAAAGHHRLRAAPPMRWWPVAALFALIGAVFGSWAARVPDVSTQVGATPSSRPRTLLHLGGRPRQYADGRRAVRPLGSGPRQRVQIESAAHSHGDSLLLLMDQQRTPAGGRTERTRSAGSTDVQPGQPHPGLEFLIV